MDDMLIGPSAPWYVVDLSEPMPLLIALFLSAAWPLMWLALAFRVFLGRGWWRRDCERCGAVRKNRSTPTGCA